MRWHLLFLGALVLLPIVLAHGIHPDDILTIQEEVPFWEKAFDYLVLGAKHMVTGLDHLLFILGIVFILTNFKDVLKYISYFTIGHSITLIGATLLGIAVNYYVIDAIIGLSVLYKGYDNLYGIRKIFPRAPDTKWIILVFGLFHGLGLASRLIALSLPQNNLLAYILSFNVGVEVGQVIVVGLFVLLLSQFRRCKGFNPFKQYANYFLIGIGGALILVNLFRFTLEIVAS